MIQDSPILVSVLCATYNHEKYIAACLLGMVSQKTNFHFEIIVHDDASTDGTQEIIREYERKYPHLIKAIYQIENQYSKGVKIYTNYIYPASRGKYFAMCEGDDYWTDPYKLQKQVEFLEQNPDYNLVYTDYRQYIQETGVWKEPNEKIVEGDVYEQVLKRKIRCQTMTICYRREVHDLIPKLPEGYFTGDWLIFLTASYHGKFKCLSEITSVYRILPESMSHFKSYRNDLAFDCLTSKTTLFFWENYPLPPTRENRIERKKHCFLLVRNALLSKNISDMKYVRMDIFPIWGVGSIINTALCFICKNSLFFYPISLIVNLFFYKKWQRKYEKTLFQ